MGELADYLIKHDANFRKYDALQTLRLVHVSHLRRADPSLVTLLGLGYLRSTPIFGPKSR